MGPSLTGLLGGADSIEFLSRVAADEGETDMVRAYAVVALGMVCYTTGEPIPSIYSRNHNYTLSLSFVPELYYLF